MNMLKCILCVLSIIFSYQVNSQADENGRAGAARVFSARADEVLGVPILADNYDSEADRWSGWTSGHTSTGQRMDFAHNFDFDADSANISGTRWAWLRGRVRVGDSVTFLAGETVLLRDTSIFYIEIGLETPAVRVLETGPFTVSNSIPLWTIRTGRGRIVGETDVRTWLTSAATAVSVTYAQTKVDSGFSNFILHDFDKDTGRTVGLTLVFRRNKFRSYAYDTTFDTGVDSVSLSASNTNFVGIDAHGNIVTTTSRMPDTVYPLRIAQTSASGIVQDSDQRSPATTFMGDAKTYVGLDTEKDSFRNLRRGRDFYWATNTETFYVASASGAWKNVSLAGVQITPPRAQYDSIASFDHASSGAIVRTAVICTGPAGTSAPWDSGIYTVYSYRAPCFPVPPGPDYCGGLQWGIEDGLTGDSKFIMTDNTPESSGIVIVPWSRRDTVVTGALNGNSGGSAQMIFNVRVLHHP